MSVTGLPFAFQLSTGLKGWQLACEIGLHHLMPIAFFVFWLAFVPKGTLALRHALMWLIFPLVYGAYSLLCGTCYAFLDVGLFGLDRVLGNIGLALVSFLGLGQCLVSIDRLLGRSRQFARIGFRRLPATFVKAL